MTQFSLKAIKDAVSKANDQLNTDKDFFTPEKVQTTLYSMSIQERLKDMFFEAQLHLQRKHKESYFSMEKINPIFYYTLLGNIEKLKEVLLDHPRLINTPIFDSLDKDWMPSSAPNYTALHVACFYNSKPLVNLLMSHGADANYYSGKVTPVGLAAYQGHFTALKTLIKHKADMLLALKAEHSEKEAGSTLLHRLLQTSTPSPSNRLECIKLLLQSGQYNNPLPLTADGRTPLSLSTEASETPYAKWFRAFISELEGLELHKATRKKITSTPSPQRKRSI